MDREGVEASHEPAEPAPAAAIGPALAPFSVPGGAGPDLGSLAALPPLSRAAAFARLQRGAGNYAVSRAVLARVEDSDLAARHEEGERQRLRDLGIDFDLERADDTTKLDAIRRLMPSQEAVRILWNSFGTRQGEVAMANKDLFEQCLKRDHSVLNLPGWTDKRKQFKEAVEGRMLDNLATNRRVVTTEMERLGVSGENKPPTREQDAYLRETQLLAEHVQRALMGMQAAKSIKVGRDYETTDSAGGFSKTEEGDAYFDPRRAPPRRRRPQAGARATAACADRAGHQDRRCRPARGRRSRSPRLHPRPSAVDEDAGVERRGREGADRADRGRPRSQQDARGARAWRTVGGGLHRRQPRHRRPGHVPRGRHRGRCERPSGRHLDRALPRRREGPRGAHR